MLPFKLGIFYFLYSLIGLDVTWFLNIFNFFPVNIPFWIYIQYLTLYNNWLKWWYNIVDIKSITTVPLVETKKLKKDLNIINDSIEVENSKKNKIWYVLGITTLILGVGFALWYF